MAKTKDEETKIHPHGDEALAEMEAEQEASRKRNREAEAAVNAQRVAITTPDLAGPRVPK